MSYRYLVLPDGSTRSASLPVLRKIKELAEGGVTLVGSRPTQAVGLANYPQCDEEVKNAAGGSLGTGKRELGRAQSRQRPRYLGTLAWRSGESL